MLKETYDVTGMTCSACSTRVEKGVAKLPGIESVSVNLLKNSMSISYDESALSPEAIIAEIEDIGYGAALQGGRAKSAAAGAPRENAADEEMARMKTRLIVSAIFTIPLFYISMGEMWGLPMPAFFVGMENAMVYALTQLLLTLPVIIVGGRYFRVGLKNLAKRAPNMDSLIAIGSGAAFIYSLYAMFKIAWGTGHGDAAMVHAFHMALYFESAAMILTLITLGKFFEARAKSRTSDAITKLMDLAPKTAVVLRDGVELEIPAEEIVTGDILIVKAGDSVPADGVITEGASSVDESAISGESLPVEKAVGDRVTGGTINKNGYFKMEATAVGEDTTLAAIIRLVDEATSSKAPIAKLADKISGIFVPVVIGIALLSAVVWLALGHGFEFSLSVCISVLVISCPCALGLATPTAIMVGTGRGAANGILIKSAESLEILHSIDTVVLDKTGTITEGRPVVTDIIAASGDENALLSLAAALEGMSGHPLAEPIIAEASARGLPMGAASDYELIPGGGISGTVSGVRALAGNRRLMERSGVSVDEYAGREEQLAENGKTPLYFAADGEIVGMIAVADPIKPSSPAAVERLTEMGIRVIMLTGDNARTAESIRRRVGLTEAIAEVLPEDKERRVRELQEQGRKVAMVGDGINDAPALARADVGLAIGAGTDVAIESADVVLMKSDLMDVPSAISLSRAVMRNIRQNLFWAFFYNTIGIPVAAGVLYAPFGLLLNPMIAAAAMSFSSVSVVTNALRLRFFTPKWKHESPRLAEDPPAESIKNEDINKGENSMNKTIKIEGMSCQHCVKAVTKALTAVPGVSDVSVSLEEKQAVLTASPDISDDALRAAVVEADFEVVDIM